jgi:hypothetical protein
MTRRSTHSRKIGIVLRNNSLICRTCLEKPQIEWGYVPVACHVPFFHPMDGELESFLIIHREMRG